MKNNSFWSFQTLKNFYIATFVAWLVWVLFLDNNNMRVVFSNRMKMRELEQEKSKLLEKIDQVKKERDDVGTDMVEKWAREKFLMRKPKEEVYVIVDEKNQPIESKQQE